MTKYDEHAIDEIKISMLTHWNAGRRDNEFHDAVRHECPFATLRQYNTAADLAWTELSGGSLTATAAWAQATDECEEG